jgi:hypothetical protein
VTPKARCEQGADRLVVMTVHSHWSVLRVPPPHQSSTCWWLAGVVSNLHALLAARLEEREIWHSWRMVQCSPPCELVQAFIDGRDRGEVILCRGSGQEWLPGVSILLSYGVGLEIRLAPGG